MTLKSLEEGTTKKTKQDICTPIIETTSMIKKQSLYW